MVETCGMGRYTKFQYITSRQGALGYIYMIMIIIRSNNIIIVDNNNKHVICTYLNSVQSF